MAAVLILRLMDEDEQTLTYEVRTGRETDPETLMIIRSHPSTPGRDETATCQRARAMILIERRKTGQWPKTGRRMH